MFLSCAYSGRVSERQIRLGYLQNSAETNNTIESKAYNVKLIYTRLGKLMPRHDAVWFHFIASILAVLCILVHDLQILFKLGKDVEF